MHTNAKLIRALENCVRLIYEYDSHAPEFDAIHWHEQGACGGFGPVIYSYCPECDYNYVGKCFAIEFDLNDQKPGNDTQRIFFDVEDNKPVNFRTLIAGTGNTTVEQWLKVASGIESGMRHSLQRVATA